MRPDSISISRLGAWQDVRARLRPGTAVAAVPAPRPMPVDAYVPRPAPAPAPVQPAALPRPRGPLEGFGLQRGSTFQIAPGTTVKGYAVSGTARVVAVGRDHVELRMKGAAAGGMVNFDVKFQARAGQDGKIALVADMANPAGGPDQRLLAQDGRIVKAAAGDLQVRTADGKQARLASVRDGLRIQVDGMDVHLVRTA